MTVVKGYWELPACTGSAGGRYDSRNVLLAAGNCSVSFGREDIVAIGTRIVFVVLMQVRNCFSN